MERESTIYTVMGEVRRAAIPRRMRSSIMRDIGQALTVAALDDEVRRHLAAVRGRAAVEALQPYWRDVRNYTLTAMAMCFFVVQVTSVAVALQLVIFLIPLSVMAAVGRRLWRNHPDAVLVDRLANLAFVVHSHQDRWRQYAFRRDMTARFERTAGFVSAQVPRAYGYRASVDGSRFASDVAVAERTIRDLTRLLDEPSPAPLVRQLAAHAIAISEQGWRALTQGGPRSDDDAPPCLGRMRWERVASVLFYWVMGVPGWATGLRPGRRHRRRFRFGLGLAIPIGPLVPMPVVSLSCQSGDEPRERAPER